MLKKLQILILLSSILILGCEKILLTGPGKFTAKSFNPVSFNEVIIYDIFDVELKSDTIYSINAEGYEDYLNHLSIKIDSGILKIRDNNRYNWLSDYPRIKLVIGFPSIEKFTFESPSYLTSTDTLKLDKFLLVSLGKLVEADLTIDIREFTISTGSDDLGFYRVRGKANSCLYYHQGSSILRADELVTGSCSIYNLSIGNSFINVSSSLEVHLRSSGNVYYKGNPGQVMVKEQTGPGKLIEIR